MMYADHVLCGVCEKELFVVVTTDVCPNCKVRGGLTFFDEDNPEVEVHESEVVNLDDRENVINDTEVSITVIKYLLNN